MSAVRTRPPSSDFEAWVLPHLPSMRRYAAVLDPRRDPDDVVQEALERAWLHWSTFRPERGSPRTWLLAIVGDRSRRRLRRTREPVLVELESAVDGSDGWAAGFDVREAVRRLARRQRQAVVLHYYIGLTVQETAAAMGCAEGTVKSALSDARRALAVTLGGTE